MMLKAHSEKQAMHCIADLTEGSNKIAKVISIKSLFFCFFVFNVQLGYIMLLWYNFLAIKTTSWLKAQCPIHYSILVDQLYKSWFQTDFCCIIPWQSQQSMQARHASTACSVYLQLPLYPHKNQEVPKEGSGNCQLPPLSFPMSARSSPV